MGGRGRIEPWFMLGIMVSSTLNSRSFNAILPAPSSLAPFNGIVDQ